MKHFFSLAGHFSGFMRSGMLLVLGMAGPAAWGQSFGPETPYSTGNNGTTPAFNSPISVALGDLNGDGRVDIVAGSYSSFAVAVLYGQANGFAPVTTYATANVTPTNVVLGDVNRDGRLDIVTGSYGNAIAVLIGTAGGGFAPVSLYYSTPNQGAGPVAIGDINNDGHLDLVKNGGNSFGVLLGQTTGGFAPFSTYLVPNGRQANTLLGDMNNDGRLDIITSDGNNALLLLGQTNGFGAATAYPIGRNYTGGKYFALADVNRDGQLDIVSASGTAGMGVLVRQAGGGFAPASFYSAGPSGSLCDAVAIGDINGDGLLDAVVTNLTTGNTVATVSVLLGQASGGFALGATYPTGAGSQVWDIALADLNGDGRLDIVAGKYTPNTVGVFLNTGTYVPLATAHPLAAADISLAPNPAHAAFTVQLPAGTAAAPATLLNALGQVVRHLPGTGPRFTVETAGLAPGIYTLRLTLGAATVSRRVVVE